MIGLIGLRTRGDRDGERVDVATGDRLGVWEWRVIRSREGQPSYHSYELVLGPRVRMIVEAFPEWRQTTFDLVCVSAMRHVSTVDCIP